MSRQRRSRSPGVLSGGFGRRTRLTRRPPPAPHEFVPEPALDAEVPAGDVVVEGRGDLHDVVVLDVEFEGAPDPAVGTDRLGDGLTGLVPRPRFPHIVLRLEHEGPRRAHADAVPAVDA